MFTALTGSRDSASQGVLPVIDTYVTPVADSISTASCEPTISFRALSGVLVAYFK